MAKIVLPPPAIIESLNFDAILDDLIADVTARFQAAGVDYDVGVLESDPVVIILEAAAYRETLLRARINDAAKANLVLYALGADLDHLAVFYGVERLDGEKDEALRDRVILAIQARSPGGSSYWYENAAKRADVRIRDVSVYREEFLPIIHVAVLSSEAGGVPDQAMLDAVTAEVTSDEVRLVNDTIVVEAAVRQTVDVAATIRLLPDAPQSVFDGLEQHLRDAFDAETGIGFNLAVSWLTARLMTSGVQSVMVTSPAADVVPDDNGAIAIGTITLTLAGRDY